MDVPSRFSACVGGAGEVPLDRAAVLLAAHLRPEVDVEAVLGRLDRLAGECPERSFAGVAAHLFGSGRLRGNAARYDEPENSMLDAVLERGTGIPITLSVVMIEVGRRLGVGVQGIGMPGHFLTGDPDRPGRYCDPFHGGSLLDVEGCRQLFLALHGAGASFGPELLVPVQPRAVLARMLANLERTSLGRDPTGLSALVTLHRALPGRPAADRIALAALLAGRGRVLDAATELEAAAADVAPTERSRLRREASRLRAGAN